MSEKGLLITLVGRGAWVIQTLCPPRGGCENSTCKTAVNRRIYHTHKASMLKPQKPQIQGRVQPAGARCSISYGLGGARPNISQSQGYLIGLAKSGKYRPFRRLSAVRPLLKLSVAAHSNGFLAVWFVANQPQCSYPGQPQHITVS